jgi:hypothetical protein
MGYGRCYYSFGVFWSGGLNMKKYVCLECGSVRLVYNSSALSVECIECDSMAFPEGYKKINFSLMDAFGNFKKEDEVDQDKEEVNV